MLPAGQCPRCRRQAPWRCRSGVWRPARTSARVCPPLSECSQRALNNCQAPVTSQYLQCTVTVVWKSVSCRYSDVYQAEHDMKTNLRTLKATTPKALYSIFQQQHTYYIHTQRKSYLVLLPRSSAAM